MGIYLGSLLFQFPLILTVILYSYLCETLSDVLNSLLRIWDLSWETVPRILKQILKLYNDCCIISNKVKLKWMLFLKHVFKDVFNFMCIHIFVCVSMCTACVCQQWWEKGIGSTGNGVMNDCESQVNGGDWICMNKCS